MAYVVIVAVLVATALLSFRYALELASFINFPANSSDPRSVLTAHQFLLTLWTVLVAGAAVIFAWGRWKAQTDAMHVSNYLTLSEQWNRVHRMQWESVKIGGETLRARDVLDYRLKPGNRKRVVDMGKKGEIAYEDMPEIRILVQALLTTFDSWLVHNEKGAFPVIRKFTRKGITEFEVFRSWRNTILYYFTIHPFLTDVLDLDEKEGGEQFRQYSPWLFEVRNEGKRLQGDGTGRVAPSDC